MHTVGAVAEKPICMNGMTAITWVCVGGMFLRP